MPRSIWGSNAFGQLGDGTTPNVSTPQAVASPGDVEFVALSAGTLHSLALDANGKAYSWGDHRFGVLGDGTAVHHYTPQLVQGPQQVAHVTAVNFGGELGSALTDNGDGTYSVVSPAHAACAADVSVEWTLDGSPQTPVSYPAGFMFTELPSVTDPVDLSGTEGDTVQFEAIADGCPAPAALTWEFSRDDGATWEPVTADPTADETATGLMLNGITLAHDDRQYRAIATNSVGSVHSASATLTVARASTGGVESPATGDSAPPKTEIAKTGGSDSSAALAVGLVLLLAGGLSVLWIRARRRHIAE